MAKINEGIALEIKALLPTLYHKDIAKKLGISKSIVDQISAGYTWKWLKTA